MLDFPIFQFTIYPCSSGKKDGGLALSVIIDKKKALLGKWLWRYPLELYSLWAAVIRSKYGQAGNHCLAVNVEHSSHRRPWKGISQILPSFLSQNCPREVAI